jgi:hypothetical protein
LQHFVNCNQSLERLDLVGQDRLAVSPSQLPVGLEGGLPAGNILRRIKIYSHLHAGPERQRGLMVPCVYDTTSDMLSFRGGLLDAGSLSDVDRQLTF